MNSLKRYLSDLHFLLDDNAKRIPWLMGMFLLVSVLDLMGIGLVGAYISLLTQPEAGKSKFLVDVARLVEISPDSDLFIVGLGVLLVALFLVKGATGVLVNWVIIRFANAQMVRLRSWAMHVFQKLDYEVYLKRNSAEYIQSIQRYVTQAVTSITHVLRLLSEGLVSLSILILLASINWVALLTMILMATGLFFGYDRAFRQKVTEAGKIANDANEQVVQAVQEGITGLKEIRVLGQESFFHNHVAVGSSKVARAETFAGMVSTAPRYLVEAAIVIFIVALVGIAYLQTGNLQDSYVLIGMFGIAILRLGPTITMVIGSTASLRTQRHGVLTLANDLRVKSSSRKWDNIGNTSTTNQKFRTLSLNSVSFSYKGSTRPAINQVSLEIEFGQSVGIMGASGSGKTTLVDLMLSLLEPTSGEILYNGIDLKTSSTVWHSKVAYLPQEVFLIDDTLRKNVALGEEDKEIDDQRLWTALQKAQLSGLVSDLARGVDTALGEHGVRLSGGQRQRVALARALYHSREVLVLDEATSALDNETEQEIVDEITSLKGLKTMIVIAHRLTTLKHCDKVVCLEGGRVIEEGTYQEVVGS